MRDEIEILYEDEDLIAVNKPPGLLMHRSRLSEDSVFLLQKLRIQLGYRIYTTHRLDRATSGAVVFGKNEHTAAAVNHLFAEHKVEKNYLAILRGWIPDQGVIDHALADPESKQPVSKSALTSYTCLSRAEIPVPIGLRYQTARFSLAEIIPLTGRRHQIRKHFAHLRHPVIGDKKHGDVKHNSYFRDHFSLTRMFLHAAELNFRHPTLGIQLNIKAPFDPAFAEGLKITGLTLPD
ncbi:MAG TPA: pseudouridylate synthase [Saprospirales bacterium]|nr:pseudouridylate synthase [Saprospirales bacterium]HAY72009.1 pseudouridylate synthase [Saprospirales bacterium]HRQ29978.1 pseudouridine synthase [Saprospiraceae bacterium]